MQLNNALRKVLITLKDYVDKMTPKKLSDLDIDIDLNSVKTINGQSPDENGNIEIETIVSWDELQNKPFGEEYGTIYYLEEQIVNLEEQDDFYRDWIYIPLNDLVYINNKYIVVFDGVEYEATLYEEEDGAFIGINYYYPSDNRDNLPFGLWFNEFESKDGEWGCSQLAAICTTDNSLMGEHTISIYAEGLSIHHLDPKYIKDMYYESPVEAVVVEETTITLEEGAEPIGMLTATQPLEVGHEYTVTLDGATYNCVAKLNEEFSLPYIGNAVVVGGEDTGESFFIAPMQLPTDLNFGIMVNSDAAEHTVRIVCMISEIHQIDEKYIPDSVKTHDWNTLENKPFYDDREITTKITLIKTENSDNYVFTDTSDNYDILDTFRGMIEESEASNSIITVEINSVLYEMYPHSYSGVYYLGFNESETTKDWVIYNNMAGTGGDKIILSIFNSNNHSSGISVSGDSVDITFYTKYSLKQLDEKYIPNSIKESIGKKAGLKVEGTVYTIDGEEITASIGAEIFNDYENNIATGTYSSAKGHKTVALGTSSYAEGSDTVATGGESHAEGNYTEASGNYSHAEGCGTVASGDSSHAEGCDTIASGHSSHAEGNYTEASGNISHAEGYSTVASGDTSHAEGYYTKASGHSSHAEGNYTEAIGDYSHAEGNVTVATGGVSHAEGYDTKASGDYQHVQGKYNIDDVDAEGNPLNNYAHIVGNGTSNSSRSNAHTVDWDGNANYAGDVYVGNANENKAGKKLATEEYVDNAVANVGSGSGNCFDMIADAKQEAIDTAAGDATTKANQALTDAKAYTDSLAGNYATAEQGALADLALQKEDITTGSANGTIAVDGTDVEVKGIGSAAYADTTAFDAAGVAEEKVNALANGVVADNTAAIAAINNVETGILKQAKDYVDTEVKELADGQVATNTAAITALQTTHAEDKATLQAGIDTNLEALKIFKEEYDIKIDEKLNEKINISQGSENAGKILTIDDSGNIIPGNPEVQKATHSSTADTATNATNAGKADLATKAEQDGNGNVIVETYETKSDALAKLAEVIALKPDWNQNDETASDYVKNRPFYTENEGEIVEIIPETYLGETNDFYGLYEPIPIVAGKKYIVTWNGVEYNCQAYTLNDDEKTYTCLGDSSTQGLSSNYTGEPFFIMTIPEGLDGLYGIILPAEANDEINNENIVSATISIVQNNEIIHKLPNKYLDLEWKPTKEYKLTDVSPINNVTFTGKEITLIDSQVFYLHVGEEYTVNWNGTEYVCEAKRIDADPFSVFYIGNTELTTLTNKEDTGEPFIYVYFATHANTNAFYAKLIKSNSTEETITVRIKGYSYVYNKIPVEFLPNSHVIPTDLDDGVENEELDTVSKALFDGRRVYATKGGIYGEILGLSYDSMDYMYSNVWFLTGDCLWYLCSDASGVGSGKCVFNKKMKIGMVTDESTYGYSVPVPDDISEGQIVRLVSGNATEFNKYNMVWEAVDPWVIESSTAGSTKKFKITVDDSGTISTTEVTE